MLQLVTQIIGLVNGLTLTAPIHHLQNILAFQTIIALAPAFTRIRGRYMFITN